MSQIFVQVLKQLSISHIHPESQGTLEPFHQTLKAMLRAYCIEFEKDWDGGVHLMFFAMREVTQESFGFSPSELVFAQSVRGLLKLLKKKWLGEAEPPNLLDYVCGFRFKLRRACELAQDNLISSQKKMKGWYDRKAESRALAPGDKVLVLLPVPGSSLQGRFGGPYVVQKKLGDLDCLISTPNRKRRSRLCHVNMLKPYHKGEAGLGPDCVAASPVAVKSVMPFEELSSAESVIPAVAPTVGGEEEDVVPSKAVAQGRLRNSEVLSKLDSHLAHWPDAEHADIV